MLKSLSQSILSYFDSLNCLSPANKQEREIMKLPFLGEGLTPELGSGA
jgi:hypothetical protein